MVVIRVVFILLLFSLFSVRCRLKTNRFSCNGIREWQSLKRAIFNVHYDNSTREGIVDSIETIRLLLEELDDYKSGCVLGYVSGHLSLSLFSGALRTDLDDLLDLITGYSLLDVLESEWPIYISVLRLGVYLQKDINSNEEVEMQGLEYSYHESELRNLLKSVYQMNQYPEKSIVGTVLRFLVFEANFEYYVTEKFLTGNRLRIIDKRYLTLTGILSIAAEKSPRIDSDVASIIRLAYDEFSDLLHWKSLIKNPTGISLLSVMSNIERNFYTFMLDGGFFYEEDSPNVTILDGIQEQEQTESPEFLRPKLR